MTADQRYILWLDGEEIGRGPERGDLRHWFCDSYAVPLRAGNHRLVAFVWSVPVELGMAPAAQTSFSPGFYLTAECSFRDHVTTGLAKWESADVRGVRPVNEMIGGAAALAGCLFEFDGGMWPVNLARGEGLDWAEARTGLHPRSDPGNDNWGSAIGWMMAAPLLPLPFTKCISAGIVRHLEELPSADSETVRVLASNCLTDELPAWQSWIEGVSPLKLPACTRRRVILDLGIYVCGYSRTSVSGGPGGFIRVGWAESLYEDFASGELKGNRGEIEGKVFVGRWDRLNLTGTGSQVLEPLLWNAGRYLEILVESGGTELTLESFVLRESRYPLEREDTCEVPIPDWSRLHDMMWRTLQMCSHETYMDCPYYEQLQYAGDTRLQMLVTYVSSHDARLPAKTLRLFSSSLGSDGLTAASYPSSGRQIIPQFSLFWVAMLRDHLFWRGDESLIRSLLPNARRVMDTFLALLREDGSLPWPAGWNWVDWSEAWPGEIVRGHPVLDATELSGINALQFAYVCGLAAEVEEDVGETCFAIRYRSFQKRVMDAARRLFWDPERRLFADTPSKNSFSEHAQCYAVLTGLLTREEKAGIARSLGADTSLAPATVYFRHYLFEAFCELGCTERILEGLELWRELAANGFVTTSERPEPSRSDCHAWGAHPIYHLYASLLGIRPETPGFKTVSFRPQLGGLPRLFARLPHPSGWIEADVISTKGQIQGSIVLPEGVTGHFYGCRRSVELTAGRNDITDS